MYFLCNEGNAYFANEGCFALFCERSLESYFFIFCMFTVGQSEEGIIFGDCFNVKKKMDWEGMFAKKKSCEDEENDSM